MCLVFQPGYGSLYINLGNSECAVSNQGREVEEGSSIRRLTGGLARFDMGALPNNVSHSYAPSKTHGSTCSAEKSIFAVSLLHRASLWGRWGPSKSQSQFGSSLNPVCAACEQGKPAPALCFACLPLFRETASGRIDVMYQTSSYHTLAL